MTVMLCKATRVEIEKHYVPGALGDPSYFVFSQLHLDVDAQYSTSLAPLE